MIFLYDLRFYSLHSWNYRIMVKLEKLEIAYLSKETSAVPVRMDKIRNLTTASAGKGVEQLQASPIMCKEQPCGNLLMFIRVEQMPFDLKID